MKKLEWNLESLFKSKEELNSEIEQIEVKVKQLQCYQSTPLDATHLEYLLNEMWEIKERTNNVLIYGSLKYYKDVTSEEKIAQKNLVEKFQRETEQSLKWIDKKIIDTNVEQIEQMIEENMNLNKYRHYINNLFRLQNHIQEEKENAKIKENINQINQQLTSYNNLLSTIKSGSIEIGGKEIELTTSNYGKYVSSTDQETRKQSYLTVNTIFQENAKPFCEILDAIYQARIENRKLEQYNSVLEKVLYEENIDPNIINTLIAIVKKNASILQTYLQLKANILNVETPHLYDFGVSLDKDLKPKYSMEEAIEIIKGALKPLGKQYIEVVEHLLEQGHVDATPEEEKHQSITFSWSTYSFMNFRGAYIDLKNLIHEIGHIVNYYLSQKEPYLYQDSTIFIGETASIINELLLNRYLYQTVQTDEEKIFYLSKNIENYFTSVLKQTMYTEFENKLYEFKENGHSLTVELLNHTYQSIIKQYYGDNIIYDECSSSEWTRLGHLYRWSYYPYKYATGLLIASVVVNSLLDEATLTLEEYMTFLSSGSNDYSLELLKLLHISLTDEEIIEKGFEFLKQDMEALEKVYKKRSH